MENEFHQILRRLKTFGINRGEPILIGLSGGADSIFLAYALHKLKFPLTACHITHDMREVKETSLDKNLVEKFCGQFNITLICKDVWAKDLPGNAEENYSRARYNVLANVANDISIKFVATGHNADDHLETILMKICRGCGAKGLGGISPTKKLSDAVSLIRPMLDITKDKVYELCHKYNLPYREDITNGDTSYARNRIRKEVLPVLKGLYGKASQNAVKLSQNLSGVTNDA